jgi:hypothetical protein
VDLNVKPRKTLNRDHLTPRLLILESLELNIECKKILSQGALNGVLCCNQFCSSKIMKTNFNSFLCKLMLQIDFGFPKTKDRLQQASLEGEN